MLSISLETETIFGWLGALYIYIARAISFVGRAGPVTSRFLARIHAKEADETDTQYISVVAWKFIVALFRYKSLGSKQSLREIRIKDL